MTFNSSRKYQIIKIFFVFFVVHFAGLFFTRNAFADHCNVNVEPFICGHIIEVKEVGDGTIDVTYTVEIKGQDPNIDNLWIIIDHKTDKEVSANFDFSDSNASQWGTQITQNMDSSWLSVGSDHYMELKWKERYSFGNLGNGEVLDDSQFSIAEPPRVIDDIAIKSMTLSRYAPANFEVVVDKSPRHLFVGVGHIGLRVKGGRGIIGESFDSWPPQYFCDKFLNYHITVVNALTFGESKFNCDFSGLPEGDYYLQLFKGSSSIDFSNPISSFAFSTKVVKFGAITPDTSVSKRYNIEIQTFPGALDGIYRVYDLDSAGAIRGPVICSKVLHPPANDTLLCSFSNFSPGLRTIGVTGADNEQKVRDIAQITLETSPEDATSGSCTCEVIFCAGSGDAANNNLIITTNACYVGATPMLDCVPALSECTCKCNGNPTQGASSTGENTLVPPQKFSNLAGWLATGQTFLIGLGVVSSIFIIPWTFVLMASGNPDKVKQGQEWLVSLVGGLLLLFLSGTLIKIVGTNLLGF